MDRQSKTPSIPLHFPARPIVSPSFPLHPETLLPHSPDTGPQAPLRSPSLGSSVPPRRVDGGPPFLRGCLLLVGIIVSTRKLRNVVRAECAVMTFVR